jgi:hypothetical protein
VEALVGSQEANGRTGDAERTRAWFRDIGSSAALLTVRRRIDECSGHGSWREWSRMQREQYVRILVSPYSASDALVAELINSRD